MKTKQSALLEACAVDASHDIDWKAIEEAFPEWRTLRETPQDPFYHADAPYRGNY